MSDKTDLTRIMTTSYIPEYLASNEDFLVFLKLAISEFNIDMDNIKNFADLVNPDKVPSQFIEALGSYSDFRKRVNADDDFNREMMMRMQSIYRERGTDKSIIMAATHGSNEGWVGGDIFIPGYEITRERASIILAKDEIFIHSRSKHSCGNRFSDSDIYRPGVIIITLPFVDDDIRAAVNENIPAGVKYYFMLINNLIPSEGSIGKYGEVSDFGKYHVVAITDDEVEGIAQEQSDGVLVFNLQIEDDRSSVAIFDVNTKGPRYRSGKLVTGHSIDNEMLMGASYRSISTLQRPFLSVEEENDILGIEVPDEPIITPEEQARLDEIARIEREREENLAILESRRIIPIHSDSSSVFGSVHSISGMNLDEIDRIIDENTGEIDVPEIEKPEEPPRVADERLYVISKSGEVLDLETRDTIRHLQRDFEEDTIYTDFNWGRKRLPKRSELSSTHGLRTLTSGSLTGVIDNYVNPFDFVPGSMLLNVGAVLDKKVSDFYPWDYQSDVEMDYIKWSPKIDEPIIPEPPAPEPPSEEELKIQELRTLRRFSMKSSIYGKNHSLSGILVKYLVDLGIISDKEIESENIPILDNVNPDTYIEILREVLVDATEELIRRRGLANMSTSSSEFGKKKLSGMSKFEMDYWDYLDTKDKDYPIDVEIETQQKFKYKETKVSLDIDTVLDDLREFHKFSDKSSVYGLRHSLSGLSEEEINRIKEENNLEDEYTDINIETDENIEDITEGELTTHKFSDLSSLFGLKNYLSGMSDEELEAVRENILNKLV